MITTTTYLVSAEAEWSADYRLRTFVNRTLALRYANTMTALGYRVIVTYVLGHM